MKSDVKNNSIGRAIGAAGGIIFAISIAFSFPVAAFAQFSGDASCCDYGSAFYSPSDYGSAFYSPSDYGSAYYSPSDYGSAYYSPSDYGSAYYSPSTTETGYTMTPEYDTTPGYSMTPEYSTTEGYTTSPEYSTASPYYSAPGSSFGPSYGTSATYGSALAPVYQSSYVPSFAKEAIYSATYVPTNYPTPRPTPSPTYTTTSAPINNTNLNTNTNTPTAVATATVAPITNTNTAATGPITNTFNPTFNPVINVGETARRETRSYDSYDLPRPYCTIYASNNNNNYYNNYNQPVTLTWNSSYATRGYISPSVGNVSANGSKTVHPNGYTTYTLTVYGNNGSATCETTANYASAYVAPAPTPIYTASPAPVAPYVSLSQIPYTGFDAGPFGNAMYWAALLAIAAAAAYLLVYFLPGRRAFAFANFSGGHKNDAFANKDLENVFKSTLVPATVLAPAVEPEAMSLATVVLPKIESHRLTTDSMIVDHSSGSPRIVIARN